MVPPPHSNSQPGEKLLMIEDVKDEVAERATELATAIGGNVAHFMMNQGTLNKLDDDEQIKLLTWKLDALKRCLGKYTTDQTPESRSQMQELLPKKRGQPTCTKFVELNPHHRATAPPSPPLQFCSSILHHLSKFALVGSLYHNERQHTFQGGEQGICEES